LALEQISAAPDLLSAESRESLLAKARCGDIVVIDVRPESEYEAGHLPFARSMPLGELEKRLAELPAGKEVVAYCRGPFCVMSDEAVALLRTRGFSAHKITDGVTEWQAGGLPIER
ncbi:rhodanese-like domain-containing protein, partial [Thauera phenolivorans]